MSYRSISRLLGACVLSLVCRSYAKPNVALAEDLEWTEKFLYDGSVHSYSVMYAWGLTQFILRAIPSRLKLAILHHRFLPQTMVGVVAAAVDTRWRYFGRSTLHKERKLSKTKASFHESGKSTMGIYMPPDIRERIENRRASLSIVDEGDSDAEIESPTALLQQALGPNGASSSGTLTLSGVDVNTSTLAPPRTPERASRRSNGHASNLTPHKSPYRRTSSGYNGNYQSYHMHHSPLLKAAARAVDKAVKRNCIDGKIE
eukprot:g13543.t1